LPSYKVELSREFGAFAVGVYLEVPGEFSDKFLNLHVYGLNVLVGREVLGIVGEEFSEYLERFGSEDVATHLGWFLERSGVDGGLGDVDVVAVCWEWDSGGSCMDEWRST